MRLRDLMRFKNFAKLSVLGDVLITRDGETFELLKEGKWINGRFDRNIRIDQPTHGVGQTHAHVYGRTCNELGVVNFDGTGSHGTMMKLHKKDTAALRKAGVNVRPDNLVEWIALPDQPRLLFG